MSERVGVYICECGPNIRDAMDVNEVVAFAQGLESVVLAKPVGLLCSAEGKTLLSKEIKRQNLTRVVFAACSPKEHESTFREILKNAGLNSFLFQTANIREHCAWVVKEKSLATDKAKIMISAAVARVMHHEPLEVKEIECQPDVLVVGAGMAGISAALTLAQRNRKVYLVEKLPSIGGKVALYEDLFPTLQCASCVLDPVADEVLHHGQIEVLTYSAVKEVLGFYGNFVVKVNKRARFVDTATCVGCEACFEVCPVEVTNEYNEGLNERRAIYIPYPGALPNVAVIDKEHCLHWQGQGCNACQEACPFGCINYEDADQVEELKVGAIVVATGFDIFDPRRAPQYGYGKIENVYTSLEFERIVNASGPTQGKIVLKNGRPPKKIALVHCVGSRTSTFNEHCSGVCCAYLSKFAHLLKRKLPGVSIAQLYSDFCLPGKEAQRFFDRVSENNGLEFLHMRAPDGVEIAEENGKIRIRYEDVQGESNTVTCDMVVLAPALEGAKDAAGLAEIFDISQGEGGFFLEENPTIAPVSTLRDGVFIAGCAQGPKDIQASVADGQAAAGKILSRLLPGEKLVLEPVAAEADSTLCSGCKICIGLCPYKAITHDKAGKYVTINGILCRGCGVCAAACPSGAIKANHYTDTEISAEIRGLVGTL
jgi:heterodisulfide reductase subunit A